MDREFLAAHLALKGGIAVRYARASGSYEYSLFVPGHRAHWSGDIRSHRPIDHNDVTRWQGDAIHPRDIPDPIYDRLVEMAIQEGAL